jgi:hypothetical protein
MPRHQDPLIGTLNKYLSKKDKVKANDKVKIEFFNEIIRFIDNNQLTSATLFDLINNTNLTLLFDTSFGESDATKHLKEILRNKFDVVVSQTDIEALKKPGNKDFLFNLFVRDWVNNPYNINYKRRLEHELKGEIGLNSIDTKDQTLAEVVYARLAAVNNEAQDVKSGAIKQFIDDLVKIQIKCPSFVRELLSDLHACHLKNDDKFDDFYIALTYISLSEFNREAISEDNLKALKTIQNELINVDAKLSTNIILEVASNKNFTREYQELIAREYQELIARLFFKLDPVLQQTVQQNLFLLERKDDNVAINALNAIQSKVTQDLLHYCPNSINPHHQFGVNKLGEKNGVANKIYALVMQEQGAIPSINRESAIGVIDKYLKTKPNKAKKDFFEGLKNAINDNPTKHFYTFLQKALADSNVHLRQLFHTKNSGAQKCIEELFQLASGLSLNKIESNTLFTSGVLPDLQLAWFNNKIIYDIKKHLINPKRRINTKLGN